MKMPEDFVLPFFAYGLFKPGQLCFERIKDLVSKVEDGYAGGSLRERDGIPLFNKSQGYSRVKGSLIYFTKDREEEAYKRIIEIEPEEIYRWGKVIVNDQSNSNVLLGKRELRGSESPMESNEWDGREDPLFKYGLREIEAILKENSKFEWDYSTLFRLQMAYIFLWTIIERYAGLRYHLGDKPTKKISYLAGEKSFIEGLKIHVKSERTVYRTTDLRKYILNPEDPKNSVEYYYQIRSNTVHRGKAVVRDFDIIKDSLTELLAIFKYVLDNTLYLAK